MLEALHIVRTPPISVFFLRAHNSSSARMGQNSRASTSISSITKMRSLLLICLLAAIVALGRIDDCIFDALLVLVHLRILNWIVVNSPRAMEQRSIPDLHRVLTVIFKSPQVGFEPTTNRLTADRSTTELLRNNGRFYLIEFHSRSQPMTNMSSKLPS